MNDDLGSETDKVGATTSKRLVVDVDSYENGQWHEIDTLRGISLLVITLEAEQVRVPCRRCIDRTSIYIYGMCIYSVTNALGLLSLRGKENTFVKSCSPSENFITTTTQSPTKLSDPSHIQHKSSMF